MTAQATLTTRHTTSVSGVALRQAYTEDPYRKPFRTLPREFPRIIPIAMMGRPVPKKKEEAMEIPKYFLKITFRKVTGWPSRGS